MTAYRYYTMLFLLLLWQGVLKAQEPQLMRMGSRMRSLGQSMQGGGGQDSLKKRNKLEDSITISFRYVNKAGNFTLDSSVSDVTARFPLKSTTLHLGNLGSAARSILFQPTLQSGFDQGMHAFDHYRWGINEVRFFQTTRPYSEINYQLGSRVEQMIGLLHTQNIKPNWNFLFQYRMINSPGIFQHQRTSHNNYLFSTHYQSKNLRYHIWAFALSNKLQAEENGGIVDTAHILDNPIYKDRFNIPVWLGGPDNFSSNFFSSKINTGNQYRNSILLWRHQYDLGKKDSLVTDSTVIPLFYPRLRLEHQLTLEKDRFTFLDYRPTTSYYASFYDTIPGIRDSLLFRDQWQKFTNDFSVYQFPDAKNLQQFFKLGLALQGYKGSLQEGSVNFVNTAGHFSYRNLTRNRKWDLSLDAFLFLTGYNSGDYHVNARLERILGKKLTRVVLGAANANLRPSFLFDPRSSFYLSKVATDFSKQNNTNLFAELSIPFLRAKLRADYSLLNNYTYFTQFYQPKQSSSLFTVFQVALLKTFRFGKYWNWHAEFYYQQRVGAAELNLMPFYTRHRLAYEGNLGFKNLDIAMGLEARYRPAYKADNYSPLLGQFFFQDSITIQNPLPDLALYANFRIRPFTAFLRVENLNTARSLDGFGFTRNNLVAPNYPLNGMHIRIGIFWQFVN